MIFVDPKSRYAVPVTIGTVGSLLIDQIIRFDLADFPDRFHQHVRTTGGDIRGSINGVRLPLQIDSIDTTGKTGNVWVNTSINTGTELLIEYGDTAGVQPAAGAAYGSQSVYTGVIETRYSLNDLYDSTSNGHDLTNSGASLTTSGKIDSAYEFDGNLDHLHNGMSSFAATSGAFIFWVKFDVDPSTKGYNSYVIGRNQSGNNPGDVGFWYSNGSGRMSFFSQNGTVTRASLSNSASFTAGQWYHFVGTWDSAGLMQMWVDGVKQTNRNDAGIALSAHASGYNFALCQASKEVTFSNESLDGILDNVYFFNSIPSDDAITFMFNNSKDASTTYTIGSEISRTIFPSIIY